MLMLLKITSGSNYEKYKEIQQNLLKKYLQVILWTVCPPFAPKKTFIALKTSPKSRTYFGTFLFLETVACFYMIIFI